MSVQPSLQSSQDESRQHIPGAAEAKTQTLVPMIFERSKAGQRGVSLPEQALPKGADDIELATLLGEKFIRKQPSRLPEVTQLEVMRHFIQLSHLNHCIDSGFYPLGSCTMKYNPKICDEYNALTGFTQLHPKAPEHLAQGTLEVIYRLQEFLKDVTGFDRVTLQPAAGAHGELVGMMMIKAYFQHRQEHQRTQVIIPDSAHGTNPASAAMCGFEVVEIPSNQETGLVDLTRLKAVISEKTAAIMLTNPNTLGLFERDILEISQLIHEAGGLLYYDGANLNAILHKAKPAHMGFDVMHINTHKTFATPHGGGGPGSGPVAVNKTLEPFLPVPVVNCRPIAEGTGVEYFLDESLPHTIGKVKQFYGNVEMMVRAFTYILAHGAEGLNQVSTDAVLNANYLKAKLSEYYHVPYSEVCKHEFILTSERQKKLNPALNTMTLVKRLMDFGIHPPTVYFPLIVHEAMMVEPTESESKATLDKFVAAMAQIAQECETSPETVLNAPYTTPIGRVDEVKANRQPLLNYFAEPRQ